jgi:hypothetical protein
MNLRDDSNHLVTSAKANSQETIERFFRIGRNLRLNKIKSEEVLNYRAIQSKFQINRKPQKERYSSYFIY